MPIPLPNLDDRRFTDLVAEGTRLIPGLAPSWTDHNSSDPGITFIELFAFVTEMLLYRADRISNENRRAFVKLLRGDPGWPLEMPIDEEIRLAVLSLRDEQRAVTPKDFVRLATNVDGVARAHCLARRNVESGASDAASGDAPAHISVLIVPTPAIPPNSYDSLLTKVKNDLEPRCLLTTRLHVAFPRYLKVAVDIVAHAFAEEDEATIKGKIEERLIAYFHPIGGGNSGLGWPFGQHVYVSDIYAVLDEVDGVDYLEPNGDAPELVASDRYINRDKPHIGVRLEPDELVDFDLKASSITVVLETLSSPEA